MSIAPGIPKKPKEWHRKCIIWTANLNKLQNRMMDICEKFYHKYTCKNAAFLVFNLVIQHRSRPELYITQLTNPENGGGGEFLHKICTHPSN
jgi:hypothetical protein